MVCYLFQLSFFLVVIEIENKNKQVIATRFVFTTREFATKAFQEDKRVALTRDLQYAYLNM
jgi:hypothetical protein